MKVKIENKDTTTRLFIDGKDVSSYVSWFRIEQGAGEPPTLQIVTRPIDEMDITIDNPNNPMQVIEAMKNGDIQHDVSGIRRIK